MKKPVVIAVLCHKGGVAKTSTTVALADSLAANNPATRVLLLDCDEQSNVKTILGIKSSSDNHGIASVLLQNIAPEDVRVTVRPQIDVIFSGGRMMRDFGERKADNGEYELILSQQMTPFDQDYDYVIIDSPPALSSITANIAMYADYCIIPCTADLLAVVGVKSTLFFLENLRDHYKDRDLSPCKVLGVVPTMYDQRRNLDMTILDDLERMVDADMMCGGIVFDPIRVDSKIKTAQVKRKLLSEIFPTSKAYLDYQKLSGGIVTRVCDLYKQAVRGAQSEVQMSNAPACLANPHDRVREMEM